MEEQQSFHMETPLRRRTNSVWRTFPPLCFVANLENQTHPADDFSGSDLKFLRVGVTGEREEGQRHRRGCEKSQWHITLQCQGQALGRHNQLGRAHQPSRQP